MAFDSGEVKQLEEINKKVVTGVLMQFWDEVLEPNMVVKSELSDLEQRLKKDNQDTRNFIAKKVSELDGTSVRRDTALNTKTNTVATKLEGKRVFTTVDTEEIRRIAPIAVSPTP